MRLAPVLALALAGCFAPEQPPATGRLERFEFRGTLVDETYQLYARLPPGYDAEPGRRFPLVLQLDANLPTLEEFAVTAGFASRLEQRGEIPPTVVVGIGYASGQQAQLKRFRDLGLPMQNEAFKQAWLPLVPDGDAAKFYQLLRDELIPHLEEKYRLASPSGRALFGHSLGGLFVLYALTRHDPAAPLFTAYVAASPSLFWDGGQLLPLWSQFHDPPAPLLLFTTAGQLEGPEMVVYFDEFIDRVHAAQFSQLTVESRKYQTDHIGNVAPSFRDGLGFVFSHGLRGEP